MDPASEPTDELLFDRFRTGDAGGAGGRDAFTMLAARHERALLGLALGILNQNRDAAMDAVQEAWLRAIRSAHTFHRRSSLKTWLFRITINACKDARASQTRTPTARPGDGASVFDDAAPFDSPALSTALDALSPDRRLLLLLCYHRDLTHPQAAEVLGIPLGTLKSRLNAALNDLRSRLRTSDDRASASAFGRAAAQQP